MARVQTTMVSENLPWRWFKKSFISVIGSDGNTKYRLSMTGDGNISGGGWARRETLFYDEMDNIFGAKVPNGVMLSPWMESTAVGSRITFGIGLYRGQYNHLDRICLLTATQCAFTLSTRCDNTYTLNSGMYAGQINVTKYGENVTLLDAAGQGGKGRILFDLRGANGLAIWVVSTTDCRVGFEIAGV